MLGSIEPRVFTPPLRELTPDTSYGFDVIRFADEVLRLRLDEYQRWLLIHGCELLDDGRPRFRRVLVIIARQNGKSQVLAVLVAYWLFIECVKIILGISATLPYAEELLDRVKALVDAAPDLEPLHSERWKRRGNGKVQLSTVDGARHLIAAANANAGRSLPVGRVAKDELREQHTYEAWDAATNAMSAQVDGQLWTVTNQGGDRSIVLHDLHDAAIENADPELGLFEWSAPPGSRADDPAALAAANPALNRRALRLDSLLAEAAAALRAGGEKLSGYLTERLCLAVKTLNPAISPPGWLACRWAGTLDAVRDRVAVCFDIAPDGQHATLVAAAVLPDGRVAVEPVTAWAGPRAVDLMRRGLPTVVARIRPRRLGWLPNGPAAEFAADMAERPGWPPAEMEVCEVRGDTPAACMGLAGLVTAGRLLQPGDPLLDAQVEGAEKLYRGDVWVFSRRGRGHVDSVYATAGAVQLARTMPPPITPRRLVIVSD